MPKFKQDAQDFEVTVAEVKRYNKHSPGVRYQLTLPKVLVERAKKLQQVIPFRGELRPTAAGLRFVIMLDESAHDQRRQLIRKAIRLAKPIIGNPATRNDRLSDQLLEIAMNSCFSAENLQEISEYLTILSELNLPPPNYVSDQNLEWAIKKLEVALEPRQLK